jgi:hypothetical protein
LRALAEFFAAHPSALGDEEVDVEADPLAAAVLTDRYALRMAEEHLGWDPAKLPKGV